MCILNNSKNNGLHVVEIDNYTNTNHLQVNIYFDVLNRKDKKKTEPNEWTECKTLWGKTQCPEYKVNCVYLLWVNYDDNYDYIWRRDMLFFLSDFQMNAWEISSFFFLFFGQVAARVVLFIYTLMGIYLCGTDSSNKCDWLATWRG